MERSFSDPVRVQEAVKEDTGPIKYRPKRARRDIILITVGGLLAASTVILAIVAITI